jgi:peptide/nickel transport system permease protein
MVLPVLALAITTFGITTRIMRSSMIEALDKDYARLAYMKGFSKTQVVYRTAFRNAIGPIITLSALFFGTATAGAVIVEDVFQYHGMGFFTVQAIFSLDNVAILALTVIIGISVIIANLVADILYGVADPRVRLE